MDLAAMAAAALGIQLAGWRLFAAFTSDRKVLTASRRVVAPLALSVIGEAAKAGLGHSVSMSCPGALARNASALPRSFSNQTRHHNTPTKGYSLLCGLPAPPSQRAGRRRCCRAP